MSSILEMGNRKLKGGRRYIKMALLTIHNEGETNLNGLHWDEQNVIKNIESAKGMPICCQFTDETKSVPLGHGFTGQVIDENGVPIPIFEDSEVVGTIENAWIENIEVNGEEKRIMVGEGYLYNHRYPNFVKWLKSSLKDKEVKSSIEIVGTEENDNHIIFNGTPTAEYREPADFSFSGTAILSVKEADENAIVLEAASLNNNNKESEVEVVDEQTIALIAEAVKTAVSEVNAKNAEYEAQIAELNEVIADKDSKIVELNASVEQIQAAIEALKVERDEACEKLDTYWNEKEILEKMLAEAKVKERLGEMNDALSVFSEEQKCYAEEEIKAFNENPCEVEINSVVDKIYTEIGKRAVAQAKECAEKIVESNSAKDMFSNVNDVDSKKIEEIDVYKSTLK